MYEAELDSTVTVVKSFKSWCIKAIEELIVGAWLVLFKMVLLHGARRPRESYRIGNW